MPGDRLNDVGSQQRILNEEARYDEGNDEVMEIVYDKEDREPPDGIGKVALADEKGMEPLAETETVLKKKLLTERNLDLQYTHLP